MTVVSLGPLSSPLTTDILNRSHTGSQGSMPGCLHLAYWHSGPDHSSVWGCAEHCRMFSSTPALYTQDARSTFLSSPVVKISDVSRHCQASPGDQSHSRLRTTALHKPPLTNAKLISRDGTWPMKHNLRQNNRVAACLDYGVSQAK